MALAATLRAITIPAEVLSADVYALFEDEAEGYGGVRPVLESFKAFRGREPTIDALLRHNGMA